ncbi:uncharacterized protein LOC124420017 [Lucilia cuprina]|uniref:uncharacterized protein LOC124420017 n=1 Tax=Lucilia cuprina TaxID=7375 RepID=UPI001F06218F|nr:uncharacterized protein LOC124420017 [Lucilia cuprina]
MPRAPIYRYTTKTQHCPKELKSKFLKSHNLTTINRNTDFAKDSKIQKKCQQIQNSENFLKRSRGKLVKRSQRESMQNITEHSFKRPKQADPTRSKESKACNNTAKRLRKQQNLTKSNCNLAKAKKSLTNCKAFNKKSKENVKDKWTNLKVIANENSTDNTRYLTDGEIVFLRDNERGNMEHYCRVENNKTVKTTGTFNFETIWSSQEQSKSFDLNCQRTAGENQSKFQTKNYGNNNTENSLKSSVQGSEYNYHQRDTSREQNSTESSIKITDLYTENQSNSGQESGGEIVQNYLRLHDNAKEYNIECGTDHNQPNDQQSSTALMPLLNTTTIRIHKPYLTYNKCNFEGPIPVLCIRNLPSINQKFNNSQSVTNLKEPFIVKLQTNPEILQPTLQQTTTETVPILKPPKPATIFKPYLLSPENKQTSSEFPTLTNTSSTSSTTLTSTQPNLTSSETTSNSLLQLPLSSYLNRATAAVSDFQDTVHASMSSIYDCSLTDKNIHEDLINLENSVDSFNKFLLQSYKDMQLMDLKTTNCLEYLNSKNLDRRFQDQHLRSQDTSLNNPPTNSTDPRDTVTILIEADTMPTKTITFKTSDIICPKINFKEIERSCSQDIPVPYNSRKLKRKNSDVSIVSNIKLTNNEILKQILPNLNKESANSFKHSQMESYKADIFKDSPINSLEAFVEESMKRPDYMNNSLHLINLHEEAMTEDVNGFNEKILITGKKDYTLKQTFEKDQDQQNRLKRRRSTSTSMKTYNESQRSSSSKRQRLENDLNQKDASIFIDSKSRPRDQILKASENSVSTTSNTSIYSLIYTKAQTNYTSFATHNPLRLYRIPNHHNHLHKPIASQASTGNPITLTNTYNHTRVTENLPDDLMPSKYSQIYRPHLYPYNLHDNQQLQVPYYNPFIPANQYYSHDKLFKPSTSSNSFEIPKSVLNMRYLPNPYILVLSQDTSLNNPPTNSTDPRDTVTILIEADTMPTKTITFKTSDIICPKINFKEIERSCSQDIPVPYNSRKLKRKNSDVSIVSNIKLTNNEILKQILPNLNKESANSFKHSQMESYKADIFKDSPINSLEAFVEESMKRPDYMNNSLHLINLHEEAMTEDVNGFNEKILITGKKDYTLKQTFEKDQDQQNRLKRRRSTSTSMKTYNESQRSSSSKRQRLENDLNQKDASIFIDSKSRPRDQILKASENSVSTTSNTSIYSLIYTKAQTNYTSFATHNPLRLYRIPNHHNHLHKPIASQASTGNPITLTNTYNHTRVTENLPDDLMPSKYSQIYRPHLYPYNLHDNQQLQVPYYNPFIPANQYYSHDKLFKPSTSSNSFEIPKSVLNMRYLPNPYSYHHYPDLVPYNKSFPASYFPLPRDFATRHHLLYNTNSLISPAPLQPFLSSEFQNPND